MGVEITLSPFILEKLDMPQPVYIYLLYLLDSTRTAIGQFGGQYSTDVLLNLFQDKEI